MNAQAAANQNDISDNLHSPVRSTRSKLQIIAFQLDCS